MKKPFTSRQFYLMLPIVFISSLALNCQGPSDDSPSGTEQEDGDSSRPASADEESSGGAKNQDSNIVLEGTPEVPDAIKNRLRQYLNTRYARLQSMSDDGSSVFLTTRFGETAQLHHVERPGGARKQITFVDEPVRYALSVPGKKAVIYQSDRGGSETYQFFRLDLEKGTTTMITDGKNRHVGAVVSRDGSRLAYSGNARNGQDMDIYISDGTGHDGESLLIERQGHWQPLEFSPDGQKLLIIHYVSINDSRIYEVDLNTKQATRVTPEEPRASYRDAIYGKDERILYVTSDREGEFIELYKVSLGDNPEFQPLSREIRWNVEGIALSSDGNTLAFATNEDGYSILRFLNTETGRVVEPDIDLPRGLISGLQYSNEGNILGFTMVRPTSTGDVYSYDMTRGRLDQWTESEIGGLNPEQFIEPTLFRYQTHDEREIPAFYYRPRGDGPFPVMIYIHGGPEGQARPRFSSLVQYLVVESGISVLVPNVRGSDGYGKSYLLLDNGQLREDSVRDIGALIDWIGQQSELDDDRVAVFGGSYGGYMVLASLVHYGERLRAGVDYVGISSFVTFLENTREYRRDLRRQEYGDERDPEMRRHLESISPLTHVGRIQSALFVSHGANDPRVPASEAEQVVSAVRESGNDVWYMLARNEGHGFRKKENRDLFIQLTVMFLEQHLGSQEASPDS